MRSLLMILLFSTCSLLAIAQAEYVFQIKDQNGNALPFVHLQVENTLKGAVADVDGYASIRLADSFLNYPLLISHVGYETKILQFETLSTQQVNEVILVPSEKELDNINVIDIGISPNDFMKLVAENLETNFYGKSYEALGYYQEKTFENEELSLEIEAELLLEAEGLNKMFGRNKNISNDNAYLVDLIETKGEQKYHIAYELGNSNPLVTNKDFRVDSFLERLLYEKAVLERQFIFNSEDFWKEINWRFINLDKIDDKKYVLVRDDRSNEAKNWLLEYWIDIENFKIRQINFIGKRAYASKEERSTEDFPKKIVKKKEKGNSSSTTERKNYSLDVTSKITLNYFEVDNLLYLKKVDVEQIRNFVLGEQEVKKKSIASFTVEELDPNIKKKDLRLTTDFPESKWWAK
ncbi:carboxypeptidase-like regulatory domain-containing protein [Fulvivirgaceae bacterium LMO-SS25]